MSKDNRVKGAFDKVLGFRVAETFAQHKRARRITQNRNGTRKLAVPVAAQPHNRGKLTKTVRKMLRKGTLVINEHSLGAPFEVAHNA